MKNSSLIKLLLASTALLNTVQAPAADYYTTRAQGGVSFLSHGDNLEMRDQAGNRRVNTITLSVINQDPVAKLILDGSNAIFSIDAPHRQLGQTGLNKIDVVINELGLASNSRQNTLRIRGRLRNDLDMKLTRVNDAIAKEISLHLGGNPQELQEEYVYDQFLNRPVLSGRVILVDGTAGKETLEYKGSNFAFKEVKLEDTDSELILSGADLNGNAAVTVTSPIFAFDPADINSITPKGGITLRENTRFTNTLGRAPSANGTWRTAPVAMLSIDAGKSITFTKDTEIINLDLNERSVIILGDGATAPESRVSSNITLIVNDFLLPANTDTESLIINNPNHSVTIKEKVGDKGSPIGTVEIIDTTDARFKGGLYARVVNVSPGKKITLGHDSEVNKISLQDQNSILQINTDANSKFSLGKADPATGTGVIPDRNGEGIIEITQAKMFECSTDVGQPGHQLSEIRVNAEAAKFAKKIYTRLMTIGPNSEVILLNEDNDAIQRLTLEEENSTLTLGSDDATSSKDISFTGEIDISQNGKGILRINNPGKKVGLSGNQVNIATKRFHNIDLRAGELHLNTVGDKVIYTQDLTIHDGAKVLGNEAIDVSGKVIIVDVKQIEDQLVCAVAKRPIETLEFKGDGQTFQYVSNEKLAKVMVLAGENQVFVGGNYSSTPLYNLGNKNILARDTVQNALEDIVDGKVKITNGDGVTGAKMFRAIGVEADMNLNADNQTDVDLINSIKGKAKGIAFVGPKTQKITLKGLFNVEGIYTAQDDSGTLEIVDNSLVSGQLGDVDRKLNKVVVRTDLGPGSSQIVGAVFVNNLELNNQGLLVGGDNSDVGAITLRSDTEIKFTGKANIGSIDAENLHEGTAKFTKGGRIGGIGQNTALNFVEFAGNNQDFFLDGNISAARIRFEGVKVSFSDSKNTHLIAQNVVDLENATLNLGVNTLNITSLGQINLIGDITLHVKGEDRNNFGKLVLEGQNCNSDNLNSLTIEATPAQIDNPMVVDVFENSTRDVINIAKLRVPQSWTKLYNGQRLSISYTPPDANPLVIVPQPSVNAQPAQPRVVGNNGGAALRSMGINRAAPAMNASAAVGSRRVEAPDARRDLSRSVAPRRDRLQENRQNRNNDRDAVQEARTVMEQIHESVNSIFRPRPDHRADRINEAVAMESSTRLLSSMNKGQPSMITSEDEKNVAKLATQIIEALQENSSSVEAVNVGLQSSISTPIVAKKTQILEYAQDVKQAADTGQLQSMIARTHSVAQDHTAPVKDLGSTVTHSLGRRLEVDIVDNASLSSSQFASSGDAIPGLSLWGNLIGAWSNQETLDVPGYAGSAWGYTIGSEYSRCGQKKLGIAYSRAKTSYSYTGDRAGDILGFTGNVLSLYGSYNRDGYFGHIIGNISRGTADTSRARIGKTTSVAQGSFAVQGYGLEGIIGHNFVLGDRFHFAPRVGLEYSYSHNNAYEEKGAGAQNLAVDAQSSTVLSGSLGFRLAYVKEISSATRVIPEILASVERELSNSGDGDKAVKTRFIWADEYLNYDISNSKDAKTSINIGGGLRIKHDVFEVSASYRYHNKLNAKYTDHQGLFSIKIEL